MVAIMKIGKIKVNTLISQGYRVLREQNIMIRQKNVITSGPSTARSRLMVKA